MKRAFLLVFVVNCSWVFAADLPPAEPPGRRMESWMQGDYGTGDWFGVRTTLADKGLEISGGYTAEVWGNTTGGLKQGTVYTGLLDFGASLDLEKLVGWKGASVSTTWLWLSGRDASEDLVGNFLTISNIAGFNTLRMLELWFQQDFFLREEDALPGLSVRVGQLTAEPMALLGGRHFSTRTFLREVLVIQWARLESA
jgi:carbohydrate-selective porin OprB